MSKVSVLRKLGVAAQVAGQTAGRNRTVRALMGAARATLGSFTNVLHQLWLEVTGVIFLIMALSFAGATFREYTKYHAGQSGSGRLALAAFGTVTFVRFGLSSFWRVRKKQSRP